MAARPTDTAEWASGASRRLEPAASEKGDGFVEGTRTPARKANWAVGILHDWIAYFAAIINSDEEHVYQSPKARQTFVHVLSASIEETNWDLQYGVNMRAQTSANGEPLVWTLEDHLPDGAVVNELQAVVEPGAARGSGSRMRLRWRSEDIDVFTGNLSRSVSSPNDETEDDGTTDLQLISVTGLSIPIVTTYSELDANVYDVHHVELLSGDTASADNVYALLIKWTDPGPRNY